MANRAPFQLRTPLAIWSGALSLFSLQGTLIIGREFFSTLFSKGFQATYCDNSYVLDQAFYLSTAAFALSKVVELGDTAFIVLRKQKLIMLHWLHHVLTLVYTFYVYPSVLSTARWFVSTLLISVYQ